jgi:Bacterial Ig-like domain (group 2)
MMAHGSRARPPSLSALALAALMTSGCALTDLDLDGGAEVESAKLPAEMEAGVTLAVEDTQPLQLILIYDDGFEEEAPQREVKWTVESTKVASVDGNSQLRGRGIGTSTVTASYRGHSASTQVMVFDYPQELELRASRTSCTAGQTLTFAATLRYRHGSTEDVAARATWTSDQPTVATVSGGVVTCKATGTARIAVALDKYNRSTDVRVQASVADTAAQPER